VTPVFGSESAAKVPFVTRLGLLHGSVTNPSSSWGKQRPLASRFELLATAAAPGFDDVLVDFVEHA
jgi:hypothetical protein